MHKLATLFALVALLTACEEKVVCPDLAAVSVAVTVTDDLGNVLTDVDVRYESELQDDICTSLDDEFLCGYEVSGDITIIAEAEGYLASEDTVTVGSDECNVITEELTLVLEPEAVE